MSASLAPQRSTIRGLLMMVEHLQTGDRERKLIDWAYNGSVLPLITAHASNRKDRLIGVNHDEEYGQASVHITAFATLAKNYPDAVDVHLCSFSRLASRVPAGVTFHQLDAVGLAKLYLDNWRAKNPGKRPAAGLPASHKPTFLASAIEIAGWQDLILPWTDNEYLDLVKQCIGIFQLVQPDLVLVDIMATFGMDAARKAGVRVVTLSPLPFNLSARHTLADENKEHALSWPSAATGCPYPIPWYYKPANLLHLIFTGLWYTVLCPRFRQINKVRIAAGLPSTFPLFNTPQPTLCPGTMALDFKANPSKDVLCFGPLVQSYPPLSTVDPETKAWLQQGGKGKTVLIALGSMFAFDEREVREMMAALETVLGQRKDVQVLWKLVPDHAHAGAKGDLEGLVKGMKGRLRVVDWLKADPPAFLMSGYIGAFVHHGGGNSYHEALGCGVPQVIIAGWADCYDFAQRVRELGLGVWANEHEAPSIGASSVSSSILHVIGSTRSDAIAATFKRTAARAALTVQEAASMPLDPVTGEELQVMQVARCEQASPADASTEVTLKTQESGEAKEGRVYVEGREALAEWILRKAAPIGA